MKKLIRSSFWQVAFSAGKKSERARILEVVNEWLDSGAGNLDQVLQKIKRG